VAFQNLKISASEKVSNGLAWLAFLLGLVGSFAATGTFVGKFVGKLIGGLPLYLNLPVALVAGVMVLFDLLDDGVPDRLRTIYIVVFWPSWVLGAQGKGAYYVNGWISDWNTKVDKSVGPWVSDHPHSHTTSILMGTIALAFIGVALYTAHRYYRKNKGAGTATTAVSVGGGTPLIGNRKQRR
jgi:hypothetical protein